MANMSTMFGYKTIEHISESEKIKNTFDRYLDRLQDTEFMRTVWKRWASIREEDRMAIYKEGGKNMTLSGLIRNSLIKPTPLFPSSSQWKILFSASPDVDKKVNYFLHQWPEQMRMLVHLGLLTAPEGIDDDTIRNNIEKDQANYHHLLSTLATGLKFIPQMKGAVGIINTIQRIMDSSMDMSSEVMLTRQMRRAATDISIRTQENLSDVLGGEEYSLAA